MSQAAIETTHKLLMGKINEVSAQVSDIDKEIESQEEKLNELRELRSVVNQSLEHLKTAIVQVDFLKLGV